MRSTDKDFAVPNIRDELRYVVRHDLMQNTARDTLTVRNNPVAGSAADAAARLVPARRGASAARACTGAATPGAGPTWSSRSARIYEERYGKSFIPADMTDPGLGHHLRRARAVLRQVRIHRGGVGQGRQHQGADPARRQSVRGAARARLSAAAAHADPGERDVRRGGEEQRLSSVPAAVGERLAGLHQSRRVEIRRLPVLRLSASASAARPTRRAARTSP